MHVIEHTHTTAAAGEFVRVTCRIHGFVMEGPPREAAIATAHHRGFKELAKMIAMPA